MVHSLLEVAGLSSAVPWGTTAEMNSSLNHISRPLAMLQPRRIDCSWAMPVAGTDTHVWSSREWPTFHQVEPPPHMATRSPTTNVVRAKERGGESGGSRPYLDRGIPRHALRVGPATLMPNQVRGLPDVGAPPGDGRPGTR